MAELGGLLVRRNGERLFLNAKLSRCLLIAPRLSKMPWDTAQMALVGGEVVAVVELAKPSGILVICDYEGQSLALSGLLAERVGIWPASEAGVMVDGVEIPALDLDAAVAEFVNGKHPPKDGST